MAQTEVNAGAPSGKTTLGYWKIRGLASQIRYLMVYLGVDYEEQTYEDRPAWLTVKDTLGMQFPNLPYLFDGELKLSEPVAIMKYIAAKYQPALLGSNPTEIAKVEMVATQVRELQQAVTQKCYMTADRAQITALLLEKVKPIIAYMGSNSYLMGQDLTYIDFTLFELCELMDWISQGKLFEDNPTL